MTATLPINAREKWEPRKEQSVLLPPTPMIGRTVEIREYLANHGPSTTSQLAAHLGVTSEIIGQTISRLLSYSAIRKLSDGKKGPGGHGATYALRCHPSSHPFR